jgi:hypothetical protein
MDRKRDTRRHDEAIEAAERKIRDNLPQIIRAQIELALGVTVQELDRKTGEPVIYTRPPDQDACVYLISRMKGAPAGSITFADICDPENPSMPNRTVRALLEDLRTVLITENEPDVSNVAQASNTEANT